MNWLWGWRKPAPEMRGCLQYRRAHLEVEELEPREVLSPLTPIQTRHAYGFDKVNFIVNGQTIRGDGKGQTIAIVVAYDHSRIFQDVDAFSKAFTLGGSKTLYQEYGASTSYLTKVTPQGKPGTDASGMWALETALDVEWVHAIAPGAKILLVEAKSNAFYDLMNAVDYARKQPGVSVVSMSWGTKEFSTELLYDSYFTTPSGHTSVTFVAASGDNGSPGLWPGVSTNVVSVGGTTLKVDSAGNYISEVGWKGSGGGISAYEPKPVYQSGITLSSTRRVGPDVAYNGDPASGFYVYHSLPINGKTGTWWSVGGTSIGAPQWAALFAIANQGRALVGLGSLDGPGQTLPALYKMASSDFRDVTSGSNGKSAASGFDLVTGRGSPLADRVIRDLVAYNIKTGIFNSATATLSGSSIKLTPASLFISVPPWPGEDAVASQTVDWNTTFLQRTQWALAGSPTEPRLPRLLRLIDDPDRLPPAATSLDSFFRGLSRREEAESCFLGDAWSFSWAKDVADELTLAWR